MAIQGSGFTFIKSKRKILIFFHIRLWNFHSFHFANMRRSVNGFLLLVNGRRACACAHALLLPLISNCGSISNESHMKTAWFSTNSSSSSGRIFSHHVSVLMCVRALLDFRVCMNACMCVVCRDGVVYLLCANRVIQSGPILIWLCVYSFKLSLFLRSALPLHLSFIPHYPSNHLILFMSVRAIDSD